MRSVLLSILPIMLWVFTAIHCVFLAILVKRGRGSGNVLYLLTGLVTVGLLYDSFMLAMGTVLKEGSVLRLLSQLRFVSHGGLIPLLFPICAVSLKLPKAARKAVWVFTGVLIALGIAEGFATVLEMKEIGGVVRYTASAETAGWASAVSGLLSYGTVVPLIIAGIVVWVKQKTPHVFLSGFLMFAFSALGPATGNFDLIFFISMVGEVLMVLFLLLYAEFRQREAA